MHFLKKKKNKQKPQLSNIRDFATPDRLLAAYQL